MSLLEQVERVLIEHPEVIVKALEVKPELVYELLVKLTPWNKLATKEDLKLLIDLINRRFEDVNRRFEDTNKRFEDINRRFESIDKRFEDINKRFEDINKRFEDMNRRFEDLRYYVDRRIGFLEKLIVGFDIPILVGLIVALVRLFM